jgi:hypothetical protein
MDIQIGNDIFEALKHYSKEIGSPYDCEIVQYPPSSPTFPLVVFDEINNLESQTYRSNFDRISTLGYRLDVFAKPKDGVDKRTIAREVAKKLNDFLTKYVGLTQLSFNVMPQINHNSIYQITITYLARLHENRKSIY